MKRSIRIKGPRAYKPGDFNDYVFVERSYRRHGDGHSDLSLPTFKSEEQKVLRLCKGKPISPHLRRAILHGHIPWRDIPYTFRLRMEEHRRLIRALNERASTAGIAVALDKCRVGRLSNLPYSPIVRCLREAKEYSELVASFEQVDDKHLGWGTIIDSLIYGNANQVVRSAKKRIAEIRKILRRLLNNYAREHREDICLRGYFELEAYHWTQFKGAEERAEILLHKVEDHLDEEGNEHQVSFRDDGEKILRKIELLEKLGYNRECKATVWVLHLHFIANPVDWPSFKAALRGCFIGDYRVVFKALRSDKSRDENLRFLAGYMLKVSPRAGRLLSVRGKTFLSKAIMCRFARIYADIGYQGIKCHIAANYQCMSNVEGSG